MLEVTTVSYLIIKYTYTITGVCLLFFVWTWSTEAGRVGIQPALTYPQFVTNVQLIYMGYAARETLQSLGLLFFIVFPSFGQNSRLCNVILAVLGSQAKSYYEEILWIFDLPRASSRQLFI